MSQHIVSNGIVMFYDLANEIARFTGRKNNNRNSYSDLSKKIDNYNLKGIIVQNPSYLNVLPIKIKQGCASYKNSTIVQNPSHISKYDQKQLSYMYTHISSFTCLPIYIPFCHCFSFLIRVNCFHSLHKINDKLINCNTCLAYQNKCHFGLFVCYLITLGFLLTSTY